jgi:hypothetical protein
MIEPLRLSFEVACEPARAFALWTERISSWWPADHTASGEDWRARNRRGWSTLIPHYEEATRR